MAGSTPGRKPKLTKVTQAGLLALLEAGVPREVACAGVGIDSRTLRIWMTRARNGEERFVTFYNMVEQAQAKAQATMLGTIFRAGKRDWRAVAWQLERCFSEQYGYKAQTKVQIEADLERILDVATTTLGPEAAAKLFEVLAGERSAPQAGVDSQGASTSGPLH